MKSKPYLSVILPAYNESGRIATTLESLRWFFASQAYSTEIIIVNDGSTDSLVSVVKKYAESMPYLRLINNIENRGKGHAVRQGMLNARGEHRLFMDADNSTSIEHVTDFLLWNEKGYDIVIGSIMLPDSKVKEESAWYRRAMGKITKFIIAHVINPGVYDTQRGFKLFSEEAAKKVFSLQTIERFSFDIELLVVAKLHNFKVKELPVKWVNPAGSKVTLSSYPNSFWDLLVIKKNFLLGRYN